MKNKLVIGMLLAIVLVFTACQKDIALTDFNSGAKKDFVVTYQKTPTEIEVLCFGEHYKVLNDNKI